MTWHCLAELQPLDPDTGNRVTIRVASANDRQITGLNSQRWEPAMISAPQIGMALYNGGFESAVDPGGATLPLALDVLKASYPSIDDYVWYGAPVEIFIGKSGQAWGSWQSFFKGVVDNYGGENRKFELRCEVDSSPFDAELLTTYAGTGDAEGGSDLANSVKPLAIGRCLNVEPVLINVNDSVYQFSGYGPIESVDALFERGADFGAPTADYADYASLVAASIAPGTWATCLVEGMVRLGAPAYGVITGDIMGHEVSGATPRLTGAIIKELASIAGISSSLLVTGSLDAMDVAVPYNVNVLFRQQITFAEAASMMALPCNHQAGVSLTGTFFVGEVDLAETISLTFDAQGKRLPQISASREEAVSPPYSKTIMGADRSWRVHSYDEIAFYAALIDRGAYSASTVYREGNIVTYDGRTWLYINPVPTSGNTPGDGSSFWESLSGDEGITTDRYPTAPPADPTVGSLWFDASKRPHRFEGLDLYNGANQLFNGIDPLQGSGWVLVQDESLAVAVAALQSIDDDSILTKDEKIRILIPENNRLLTAYNGLIAQASSFGISLTDLTTAWTAWTTLRDSLSPDWDDRTQDTPINRTDWDSTLNTLREEIEDARALLQGPTAVSISYPAAEEFQFDSAGALKSGQVPIDIAVVVKRGATVITLDDEVSYAITPSADITATIENTNSDPDKGTITITDVDDEGYIDVTVTVDGIAFPTHRITILRKDDTDAVVITGQSVLYTDADGNTAIHKWGTSSSLSVTFPVAFPNACDTVNVTLAGAIGQSDESDEVWYVSSKSASGFTVSVDGDYSSFPSFYWSAWGD